MRQTCSLLKLGLALVLTLCSAFSGEPPISHRDGTLEDLATLAAEANLAGGAFGTEPVSLDAHNLPKAEYVSRRSTPIRLQPARRYTLSVRYRGEGNSVITVGVQWVDPDRPSGLAEVADMRAALAPTTAWTEQAITFEADPKLTQARILIKAYGGTRCEIGGTTLVEGWYAD